MSESIIEALADAQNPAQRAAVIAESIFARLPDDTATVGRRCVILHWFDPEIVAALCPDTTPDPTNRQQIYDQLTALPFFEKVPWGLAYHELTRTGLLERYTESEPAILVTGARLAAPSYAARRINDLAAREAFFCQVVSGDTESALASLDVLLAAASAGRDWSSVASIFLIQDEAEALPFVQRLPRHFDHWFKRGIARFLQGDLVGAIAVYDQALALDPKYATVVYLARGLARNMAGDMAGALADCDQAIALNSRIVLAYYCRGGIRVAAGDVAGALADYDQAIALNPQDASVYTARGGVRAAAGDTAGALADYDEAITLNPQDVTTYVVRGLLRVAVGDTTGALADYDQAIALNPQDPTVYAARGSVREKAGDVAGALADYNQALTLNPRDPTTYVVRGLLRVAVGDTTGALADYDQAIALNPQDALAIVLRGETYRGMGEYELALADFDRALMFGYDRNSVLNSYGLTLSYLRRYAEAIDLYQECLTKKPNNYAFLYNIAVASARWKGPAASQNTITQALDALMAVRDTEPAAALYGLGGLAALTGNETEALDYLEKAIALDGEPLSWAQHDVAWLDLRTTPRFRQLVFEQSSA